VRSRRLLYAIVVPAILIAIVADVWWMLRPDKPPKSAEDSPPAVTTASYVGNDACAGCHAQAYAAWKDSQHALAMQHASDESVLADFENAKFRYAGTTTTFFRRDGKYFVRTDGTDGKLADFEIEYTYGVEPLQQYLIAFSDGRLQALSIAWDSRPKAQGGQRWFHLYPDDNVDYRDELHWTRRSQNWNFMCADCHSTEVRKQYDAATNTFDTTWTDISVGCEACHGPSSAHLEWAETKSTDTHKGLAVALDERASARWITDAATGKPARSHPRKQDTEIEVCAQCHARRSQIAEGYRAGLPFMDFYRPALLSPGLYHTDGQQRDEVYTWGSFLQSRMYHAGVTCSDCHEPHTQKLRATGNAVCSTCHLASKYDDPAHHHHPLNGPDSQAVGTNGVVTNGAEKGGAGNQCVECHMPATTYMVVDPRRDHSLRVPRPDLTITQGTPNACNGCHSEKDAQWAANVIEQWYGHHAQGFQRYSEAFAYAASDAAEAAPSLARIARDPSNPAIARASALEALARYPSPRSIDAARKGLIDGDALVRRASIAALAPLPPEQRLKLLAPLLDDPVRTVRMEATSVLADSMGGATMRQLAAFKHGAVEYESAQRFNADRPEARASLGNFYARQGRFDEAHAQLQSTLDLDPEFVPAYVNLADLLRTRGRDAAAGNVLRIGIQKVPDAAALHHALGLTLVRLDRSSAGLAELKRAAKLLPADARFAYVYAVGLSSAGKTQAALAEIDRALKHHPDDRDLLLTAAIFRRDNGDIDGARRYAERLSQRYPNDSNAAQLARELGATGN
jgi:tetratricopeptide (TPR) repeat protein